MAKKRSWFNLVKRLFSSETDSKPEKKEKKSRKWVFWGKFKVKSRLPSLAAAPSLPREVNEEVVVEENKERSKHALDVALASAAAAEAAVAAAHLAAEVVWLTGVSQSNHQSDKETEQHSSIQRQAAADVANSTYQDEKKIQESFAIKIQTAFRAYLARKALRALKGIVKLQAIIRGRNVRRQAMNTLKCLQSIVNIQSQVCARRIQMADDASHFDDTKEFQTLRDKIIKMDTNSQKRWDGSILTKEEADAKFQSKKEAAIKRERIKEYSFIHRNSAETDRSKVNGRLKYWLEQWVDTQIAKSNVLEDLDDSVLTSSPKNRLENKEKPLKLKSLPRQYDIEGLDSPIAAPRRSFHRKQCSLGEDNSLSGSPLVVPTYMATTESAKAKARSLSSPKLRPGSFDVYSESYSPCKNRLFPLTLSTNTEIVAKPYQQRSPCLKGGLPSPVKSSRTLKDLSLDSECSFRTWDRQSTFR